MPDADPLHEAVLSFRDYFAGLPGRVSAVKLLRSRPLAMYWALGLQRPEGLAHALVADRLAASREMALGYLYERVIESVGRARKLTNAEKREWRGIDFRKESGRETLLINLKSARATSNADISDATMRNLAAAVSHERESQVARGLRGEDNPLAARPATIRAIRALARGNASTVRREYAGEEVEVVVGDDLWRLLGTGDNYGRAIQAALGANPVDPIALQEAVVLAEGRVVTALHAAGCVRADGDLDWPTVLDRFPDV